MQKHGNHEQGTEKHDAGKNPHTEKRSRRCSKTGRRELEPAYQPPPTPAIKLARPHLPRHLPIEDPRNRVPHPRAISPTPIIPSS